MTLQTTSHLLLGIGVLSMLTVVLAIMALQDIYHGEADLTLEWMMLRVSLVVNIIFHVLALIAFWKASRLPVRWEPRVGGC